jgi:hypothetical protein
MVRTEIHHIRLKLEAIGTTQQSVAIPPPIADGHPTKIDIAAPRLKISAIMPKRPSRKKKPQQKSSCRSLYRKSEGEDVISATNMQDMSALSGPRIYIYEEADRTLICDSGHYRVQDIAQPLLLIFDQLAPAFDKAISQGNLLLKKNEVHHLKSVLDFLRIMCHQSSAGAIMERYGGRQSSSASGDTSKCALILRNTQQNMSMNSSGHLALRRQDWKFCSTVGSISGELVQFVRVGENQTSQVAAFRMNISPTSDVHSSFSVTHVTQLLRSSMLTITKAVALFKIGALTFKIRSGTSIAERISLNSPVETRKSRPLKSHYIDAHYIDAAGREWRLIQPGTYGGVYTSQQRE